MKYIVSRYNHSIGWLQDVESFVLYDRSEEKIDHLGARYNGIIFNVPNIGSDIYDKFTYIIDNYDNLPDVAVYTKCNIFNYISEEEFDKVKDNKTFTPLLTQNHKTYMPVCYYKDGMYYELNNTWYLGSHPCKHKMIAQELQEILGIAEMEYVPFAPGSNYILPKENILKHPKAFYEQLRSYLEWDRYPGEAQIMERGLYTLWK